MSLRLYQKLQEAQAAFVEHQSVIAELRMNQRHWKRDPVRSWRQWRIWILCQKNKARRLFEEGRWMEATKLVEEVRELGG